MVLEGFGIPSWAGWLSGILFYRTPWGIPNLASWWEPFLIYHILVGAFANLLWADYIIHYSETFAAESFLRRVITKVFTYMAVGLFFYMRICFLLKAKSVARFLGALERHPTSRSNSALHRPLTWTDQAILWFAFLLHVLSGATFSAAVGSQRQRDHSWFSWLSKFEYSVTFFLFGTFPVSAGSFLAFAYSFVTTKHLVWIYDEFCSYYEVVIRIEAGEIPQVVFEPPAAECRVMFGQGQSKVGRTKGAIKGQKELMRENLVCQFDIIMNLFEFYDGAVGPFLLGLIVTLILYFVQTINAILILNLSPLFLFFDWSTLIYLVFQLIVILFNLGHFTHKRIQQRKMKLRRMLATTPNTESKAQLAEILNLMMAWKWKMTAWGFFEIDRHTTPGILSIMMSYVVILFQIQLNTSNLHDEVQ